MSHCRAGVGVDMYLLHLQMLNTDQLARVSDFVAVPGCGLKCDVSQIETLLSGSTTDVRQFMSTHNSTASFNVTCKVRDVVMQMPAATESQFGHVLINTVR